MKLRNCAILATLAWASPQAHAEARRIVIDPGHGGSNLGAKGAAAGVMEKDVTLALSQEVATALRGAGLEVVLTRTGDQTLTLRQRSAAANAARADLFISVHANAAPKRNQRGFETYVLTPGSVEVIAPALRSDEPTVRPGVTAAVANVLDDVERGATQWEAAELAVELQTALRATRGGEFDRGVRQDAQHVLLGATMPAVLVEVGFVDHPVEGRELIEPRTRTEIAKALAQAILREARALSR
ncbi:MAG: N-acetylmuramoyl-L-alanine amidase [Kofleriaceae bacterium]